MNHDDPKDESVEHADIGKTGDQIASDKQTSSPGMTSSETDADQAPRHEGFLESLGRAIGEVTTVPAGPDSIDDNSSETHDERAPKAPAP